jgi:hypothetical protein
MEIEKVPLESGREVALSNGVYTTLADLSKKTPIHVSVLDS